VVAYQTGAAVVHNVGTIDTSTSCEKPVEQDCVIKEDMSV